MKILIIKINEIIQPQMSMRQQFDLEKLEELKSSIKAVGLINPITLRKVTKGYEVIAGARRLEACKLLGWTTIPSIVYAQTEEESEMIKIQENIQREDVDPIDEGAYLMAIKEKYGYNQKQLAELVLRTESYVSERLRATEYHPELKRAVKDKLIPFSVARELAKINDLDQLMACLNSATEYGTTPIQARAWVQQYKAQMIMNEAAGPISDLSPDEELLAHSKLLQTCQICGTAAEPKDLIYLTICRQCSDTIKKGI